MSTSTQQQLQSLTKPAPIKPGSTQSFIEIEDIREQYVLLKSGNACSIIEIQATNFALLSKEEQRSKLMGYASFLNSLSFPIQIVIQSKRIDITSYIKSLEEQGKNIPFNIDDVQKSKIASYVAKYQAFIEEMIKVNIVLDKKFYLVIPYASLEQGAKGALRKDDFFEQAKASLKVKTDSLLNQILHLNLKAKILDREELIAVFYQEFNGQSYAKDMSESAHAIITEGKA